MNAMETEYKRMKAAFWEIWPLVMEGLESDLIHNRPKEFWGNVRKLRNAIDSQIEPDLAVVPTLGVCFPVPHCPVTAKSRQEATVGPTKARSAAVGAVRASGKCQFCEHWKVGGPGVLFACQNELSPHWMKNSGAAWTCEKFERRSE